MKNVNAFLMIGVLFILSMISMYLAEVYTWNYDNSTYQLTVDEYEYDLKNPDDRWQLPNELEEISGLSYIRKNQLACVEDEHGIFYTYNLKKREIVRKDKFAGKGDYEGVEVIRDTAYVLKSNGTIYYFLLMNNGIGEVIKIETDLSTKNDTEGLGFNMNVDELLIGCKEKPGTKKVDVNDGRSIYHIALNEKKFKKKPKYIITGKSYKKMLEKNGLSRKKHTPFKPSGVAVHPISHHIFVIASVGKMLMVLNQNGDIVNLIPLDPEIFRQPEGICFSPSGDLYIASEGRGKKGYILKF